MTELEEFVARLIAKLDAARIPYMLVGSMASSIHGKPRSTRDVDVVIRPESQNALDELIGQLPSDDYYVSDDAAREAFRRRTQFNIIEMASMWKADLIIPEASPFQESESERTGSRIRTALGPRTRSGCALVESRAEVEVPATATVREISLRALIESPRIEKPLAAHHVDDQHGFSVEPIKDAAGPDEDLAIGRAR